MRVKVSGMSGHQCRVISVQFGPWSVAGNQKGHWLLRASVIAGGSYQKSRRGDSHSQEGSVIGE